MATTTIETIKQDRDRVSLTARVTQLKEPTEKQAAAGAHQAGVLEDGSGQIRFISWARDDPPTLDEGTEYAITNARTDFYRGNAGVVIDDETTVEAVGA